MGRNRPKTRYYRGNEYLSPSNAAGMGTLAAVILQELEVKTLQKIVKSIFYSAFFTWTLIHVSVPSLVKIVKDK